MARRVFICSLCGRAVEVHCRICGGCPACGCICPGGQVMAPVERCFRAVSRACDGAREIDVMVARMVIGAGGYAVDESALYPVLQWRGGGGGGGLDGCAFRNLTTAASAVVGEVWRRRRGEWIRPGRARHGRVVELP